jgi:hypothetical protein
MSVLDSDGVLTDEVIDTDRGFAFVPTRQILGQDEQIRPELRRTADGRLALPAYTSLDRLLACCGDHQSWVLVPTDWFERIREECGVEVIALNVALPVEWRQRKTEETSWPGRPEAWDE